jgi:hypothetical protein
VVGIISMDCCCDRLAGSNGGLHVGRIESFDRTREVIEHGASGEGEEAEG